MRLLYCLVYFLLRMHTAIPMEYIYPVASLDNAIVLYIHQISPQNIQLFEWNTIANHAEQALWSLFNPADIRLLPDNRGFSFIDNGRLRIKAFQKRSPKTIDFDEPIFNINGLCWIDEHTCYCSAQQSSYFSIFELYDDGRVKSLIPGNQNTDCMYPQKVNNQLFYIQRYRESISENDFYAIIQTPYDTIKPSLIIDFNENPIVFLQMISETEGFVIEHQREAKTPSCDFLYHHIVQEGDKWQARVLFSFTVPTALFLYNNDQRLFESILPLLPRIINGKIYFVDSSQNNNKLELYVYDLLSKQKNTVLASQNNGHIFPPIFCNSRLYCGGTKTEDNPAVCPFMVF